MGSGAIHKVVLLVLVSAGVLVFKLAALPNTVHGRIARQLDQIGLSGAEFTIRRCGWHTIELQVLRWDGGWSLHIERVYILYDHSYLGNQPFREIVLEGGHLSAQPNGACPKSLLAQLTEGREEARSHAYVRFDGRLTRRDDGTLGFQFRLDRDGTSLDVRGSLVRKDGDIFVTTKEMTFDAATLAAFLTGAEQGPLHAVQGEVKAAIRGRIRRGGKEAALDVDITGDHIMAALPGVRLQGVASGLKLRVELSGRSVTVFVLPESWVEFDSATIAGSRSLGAMRVESRNDPHTCAVRARCDQDGIHALVDLAVACTDHSRTTACESGASAADVEVRGSWTLRGDCRLTDGEIAPRIVITAQDASIILPRCRIRLDGVTGSLIVPGSFDVHTPEKQYLLVRQLTYGPLHLNQGRMKLYIAGDPAVILVEQTEWEWLGASIHSDALCFDRTTGAITGTIFINDLSLAEILSLCLGDHAVADGMLDGQVTFGHDPAQQRSLHVDSGVLAARPGGGYWTISTPSARAAIESSSATLQTPPRHSQNGKVCADLLTSLLDFEYDTLQIELTREAEGLIARVSTSGRTRASQVPIEFEQVVVEIPGAHTDLPNALAWR